MNLQRRRRPFVDLRSAEILTPALPRLFLGRFDEEALRHELEQARILDGLLERGYPEISLRTEYEGGEHRLRLDAAAGGGPSLVDLRLAKGTMLASEPLLRESGVEVLSFLSVHWMSLQDPAREFTPERPRLPGQRHPGLGLARPPGPAAPALGGVLGQGRPSESAGVLPQRRFLLGHVVVREFLASANTFARLRTRLNEARDPRKTEDQRRAATDALLEAADLQTYNESEVETEGNALFAGNRSVFESYVDYSDRHYFNVVQPWVGSASATAELAADGTLGKAEAEVEQKTIETLLSLLPVKEYLTAKLVPSDVGAARAATPKGQPLEVTVVTLFFEHKVARYDGVTQPCRVGAPLSLKDRRSLEYARRQLPESLAPEEADAASKITVSGEIRLPAQDKKPD